MITKNFSSKIVLEEMKKLGKVKYNDKILHQSKIIKILFRKRKQKKIQKDLDKIFKKINKNKKYFYSAKDLALIETLVKDGFKIPKILNIKNYQKSMRYQKTLFN